MADFQILFGCNSNGEINQHIDIGHYLCQVISNGNTHLTNTRNDPSVLANNLQARQINSRRQVQVR